MTKLNEITNNSIREARINDIKEMWRLYRQIREKTLARINNYLFTINSGGLLASLTYVAAKEESTDINLSIWLFSLGIFFTVLHAAIDYYLVEKQFANYMSNAKNFLNNEAEWEDLTTKSSKKPVLVNMILHILGWSSGIAFLAALTNGIIHLR